MKWRVYKQRTGFFAGAWIIQPPGADFENSFCCYSFRSAWMLVGDPRWREFKLAQVQARKSMLAELRARTEASA